MANKRDITAVFERAVKENASDVVITSGVPPIIYLAGKLHRYGDESLTPEETQQMLYAILQSDQIASFERNRELDFSFNYDSIHRFRGNAFWQRGAVGAAFRLISNDIPKLADLGLPAIAKEFADATQGLILITGATGSGKSTTMASMIDYINNKRSCHIVTIEDPIEYVHQNKKSIIEQREVGTDTNDFPTAVKYVLRQAPHIIMVGEMRDLDTIRAVLTAAETGHLVMTTLHTNDAPQSVERIVDVFPPSQQEQIRVQLSMSLMGIIAQRLLPHVNGKDRVLACEVMRVIPSIAHLIRESKTALISGMIETQSKHGMQTMDSSVKAHYLNGSISAEIGKAVMKHPGRTFG